MTRSSRLFAKPGIGWWSVRLSLKELVCLFFRMQEGDELMSTGTGEHDVGIGKLEYLYEFRSLRSIGLTHIPTSRKLLLTERWNASAKLSLGSRLFQRCILQELQRTRTLVTQNHVDILVGHYPATRSSCDKGAKSSSTIKPNTSTISSLNVCLTGSGNQPNSITVYTTSYQTSPWLPSLSEDDFQASVSLQDAVVSETTLWLYHELGSLSTARFAHRRLYLPCITFLVTEVRGRPAQDKGANFTYQVKAKGLHDLLLTTENQLIQFWPGRPALKTFYLVRVRPCNRDLLELPDFAEPPLLQMPRENTGPHLDLRYTIFFLNPRRTVDPQSHSRALCALDGCLAHFY
ncbi:hypothetical protein CY34DRAFT_14710 [Suillus luteus UH-Slu-Lm8-n1]|uniref:Uncharacterized protein n=1 Tax=Suillus luteus UH-Slu-Lm8-n1 TaxID=930992 RepID=A0A0D0AB45_9AGAM|nr:hypothetical protein CY34DRAFT_14710 [Suillus luteus UH-Slu-Lm8-n1]